MFSPDRTALVCPAPRSDVGLWLEKSMEYSGEVAQQRRASDGRTLDRRVNAVHREQPR